MSNLIGQYKNGNYDVYLFNDGTKIRCTQEDELIPAFAENMDIKITDRCNMECPWCHEGSTKEGKNADIMNEKFIDTLHPYQEVALGGGNVFEHPDFIPFLDRLKALKIIPNITVNQRHFMEQQELLECLTQEKLIYGLGVSLVNPDKEFIRTMGRYSNGVIHVINGIFTEKDYNALKDRGFKILILGYKNLRRGSSYYEKENESIEKNQKWLYDHLEDMLDHFSVVSFDNLAIEQLNVKRLLSEKEWEKFYMGDDAEYTYYIDMVNRTFSESSTSPFTERYPLMDSVDDMFKKIRKEKRK